jgi:hypothetical protein
MTNDNEWGSIWSQISCWLKWKLGINYYKVIEDK